MSNFFFNRQGRKTHVIHVNTEDFLVCRRVNSHSRTDSGLWPLWSYQPSSCWKHRPQGEAQRNQTANHQTTQPMKESRNLILHQHTHKLWVYASFSMITNYTTPIVLIFVMLSTFISSSGLFQLYFSQMDAHRRLASAESNTSSFWN